MSRDRRYRKNAGARGWVNILSPFGRIRAKLRQSEIELAGANNVLAMLPDPIILVDRQRRIVRVNPAAEALFGTELLSGDLGAAIQDGGVLAATDLVLAGSSGEVVEFQLTEPVSRHLRARIAPLPDYPGAGFAALLAMNDLTEVKLAEQMRADFVANASHELRTPLSTLLGFIETLQGSAIDDPDTQRRFLPIMQQQAARMARLVDDLLSLSRIELKEHVIPTTRVHLPNLLKAVAQALRLRAGARGMTIEVELPASLPPVIGDADELTQVFQNLIDNAIKYANADSAIVVSAALSSKLQGGVAISVADRGEGISRRHLPRLTERFYRVDNARSREAGGTGLGLAIVKHVVNRHRGLMEIESETGEGSIFTVHLRSMAEAAEPDAEAAERRVAF